VRNVLDVTPFDAAPWLAPPGSDLRAAIDATLRANANCLGALTALSMAVESNAHIAKRASAAQVLDRRAADLMDTLPRLMRAADDYIDEVANQPNRAGIAGRVGRRLATMRPGWLRRGKAA
jgi:hypothetical protein